MQPHDPNTGFTDDEPTRTFFEEREDPIARASEPAPRPHIPSLRPRR